jgi:geranylgeranyl pyrophosphate synthase
LNDKKADVKEKVSKVTSLFNELNVKEDAEKMIAAYIEKALTDLGKVNASFYRKSQLKEFFLKLAKRDF